MGGPGSEQRPWHHSRWQTCHQGQALPSLLQCLCRTQSVVSWDPPKREQTTLNYTSAASATTACIGVYKPRAYIAVNVLGMGLMVCCVMAVCREALWPWERAAFSG